MPANKKLISPDTLYLQYLCEWSSSMTPSRQTKSGLHEPLTPMHAHCHAKHSPIDPILFSKYGLHIILFGEKTSLSSAPTAFCSWLFGHSTHTRVPGARGHPSGPPTRLSLCLKTPRCREGPGKFWRPNRQGSLVRSDSLTCCNGHSYSRGWSVSFLRRVVLLHC